MLRKTDITAQVILGWPDESIGLKVSHMRLYRLGDMTLASILFELGQY